MLHFASTPYHNQCSCMGVYVCMFFYPQSIITEGNARLHYATNNRVLIYKVIVLLPRDFPAVEGERITRIYKLYY